MINLNKKNRYGYFFLFSIITIMYLILFNKFILRDYVYVYSIPGDIGSDTLNSYYPLLAYISNMIHQGNLDIISLNSGLGVDMTYVLSYFSNPLDIVTVLFPVEHLNFGILLSTYLKLTVIAFVSFAFFRLLIKNKTSCLISTIAWTFCSYTLIWGQHYHFCTQMANFTIFVYLLQKWLLGSKKSLLIMIPFMSFYVINSYYFFYISGIFSAVYVLFYCLFKGVKWKDILYKLLSLFFVAVVAILISSVILFPIIYSFNNSMRSSGMFNLDVLLTYLKPYDKNLYLTDLSRLLNSDLVGDGYLTGWSGTSNYYESAFLSSSILSIFSIIYQFLEAKNRKIKIYILAIVVITLLLPIFTHLLTFNILARRWTFILIFVNCICIGKFISSLQENSLIIRKTVYIGISIISIILLTLFISSKNGILKLNSSPLIMIVTFTLLYFIILYKKNIKISHRRKCILGICILEILCVSYLPINSRGVEKKSDFNKRYYDETRNAVNYLKEKDKSLYRISKNYKSVFLNDSLAQNYYGFDSYSSVNSKYLWSIAQLYDGVFNGHPNYIGFNNILFQNFAGAKYLLSKEPLSDYELENKIGNIFIYKMKYEIPFGYMYNKKIQSSEFNNASNFNKIRMLAFGFVSDTNENYDYANISEIEDYLDLKTYILQYVNCKVEESNEGVLIADNDDPYILMDFNNQLSVSNEEIDTLSIKINVKVDSEMQVYFDMGNGYNENDSIKIAMQMGENNIEIPIEPYIDMKSIRIDPINKKSDVNIEYIRFSRYNDDSLKQSISKLQENGLQNVVFEDSTLLGRIQNNEENNQMLMVPITYDKNWKGYLNGQEVIVENINGGFIGIQIPEGNYDLKLTYQIPNLHFGSLLSCSGLLIYACILLRTKRFFKVK